MTSLTSVEVAIMLVLCAIVGTVLVITIGWFLRRLKRIEGDFWGANANWDDKKNEKEKEQEQQEEEKEEEE